MVAPTVAATSSNTDNDLPPAPASPLETARSTANSYFTRLQLDADVDPDVMPIEIDEWFRIPPAAVPEAPQQRVLALPTNSDKAPTSKSESSACRAVTLSVNCIVIFFFASFCISGASTTTECPG